MSPRRLTPFFSLCTLSLAGAASAILSRPATAQSIEAQVVVHFRAAQQATQAGQLDRAVEEYKKVLRLDPTLIEARTDLGLAYHMLGQYDLSVAELAKAARAKPQLLAANLFLGIGYLKLGLVDKAFPPLERALAADPSNREAHRALAACYLAKDNYREAAKHFQTLFNLEPSKEEGWFRLGRDDLDMARRLTARLSQEYRTSAWAQRLAGDVLADRNLWNDAVRAYRQALTSEPAQPDLHARVGTAYLRQSKLEDAEAEFRRELELDPGNEPALLGLAEVELARGRARAALEDISKVCEKFPAFLARQSDFAPAQLTPEQARQTIAELEGAPDSPARHVLLSSLYSVAGDMGKARDERAAFQLQLEAWQEANSKPKNANREACAARQHRACADFLQSQNRLSLKDNLLLGKSSLALGQDERAADAFAAALAPERKNPEAMYWLDQAYMKLSDRCFTELVASFPDSWRAHQLRAEAYQLRQAEARAIEEYQIAVRLKPDAGELHEALGEIYLSKNLLAEARPKLERAVQLNPAGARSLYLLGRLLVLQHEPARAVPYLERALRYEPNLLEARANLGRAYLRAGKPALAVPELEKSLGIDHYGDLHYLLYQAYHSLGKDALAQKALARSQELRRSSAAGDQAKLAELNRE